MIRKLINVWVFAVSLSLSSEAALGQVLTVGNSGPPDKSALALATVQTDIDLASPANATGAVDKVTFGWSATGCTNAVKIKFFRRFGDTLRRVDERGPFNGTSTSNVPLSPPVNIEQGDLIGITRLTGCGGATTVSAFPFDAGFVAYSGDVEDSVSVAAGTHGCGHLVVQATGLAAEAVAGTIPVVVSTPGRFGSFFKTSVQISSFAGGPITGRFVLHPAGVPGSLDDPSLAFLVQGQQTISYPDILEAMGQAGIGSIDLVGSPVVTCGLTVAARVYNDAGTAGTSGMSEDMVVPGQGSPGFGQSCFGSVPHEGTAVPLNATGFLLGPIDAKNFRYEVGVRTFFVATTLLISASDSSGAIVGMTLKTYPPMYFEQVDAAALIGASLGDNGVFEISVNGTGSAIVYGVTVDNTTNDPSIQFARSVRPAIDRVCPPQ